jgi:ABC-type branched-subunit amino acid transport system permease subunit
MGSSSDWETMRQAAAILAEFGVAHECRVVSAHRMPDAMFAYAEAAAGRGLVAIIAGMSNARGIVIVGFAYGVLERFIEGFGNTSLREVLGFGIMILLLLAFPNGLFGKREVNKV